MVQGFPTAKGEQVKDLASQKIAGAHALVHTELFGGEAVAAWIESVTSDQTLAVCPWCHTLREDN